MSVKTVRVTLKKILIIGATSAIAEHCARLWAARGDAIYLVGRDRERLEAIKQDLTVRGATKTALYVMDLNDFTLHAKMLKNAQKSLNGFDTVLIAHGTLSDQKACEQDVEMTLKEINTNALSTIALLTHIANDFEEKKNGTIAVISSVAGDRGRASNYIYGSAKAMITTFTSGLRQRLYDSNVAVVTIKPGFVDTPMTTEFKKGLLWTKPSVIAEGILKSIDQRKDEVYLPSFWGLVMIIIKILPKRIFYALKI
jgi:short-subunit dehydrogenase